MAYTIVTGAASDIGKAVCQDLASNGKHILMIDIDEASMAEFSVSLHDTEKQMYLVLDLSDPFGSQSKLIDFIKTNNLVIESAVFAAGIFSVKPLRMINHDFFIKSLDIAIFSVITIMQIVTSKNINGKNFKSAVIISSISARQGVKGYSLYSTVKAGLLGLMHSLAVEFAPVRINAIVPGGIKTKATAFIYNSATDPNSRGLLGEGEPKDFAKLISFLLSEDSKWITGQEFVIDGGSSIN